MKFEYAIMKDINGHYYTGSVYGTQRDWSPLLMNAFTYTEKGAYLKMQRHPEFFKGCVVVRVF